MPTLARFIQRCSLPLIATALLACAAPLRAEGELPPPVAQALRATNVPNNAIGVWVQEVGAAKPLVVMNPRTQLNPASAMKLVTTFAALELLGPGYTWKTEALTDGTLAGGVLTGNLYLRGSGDPKLTIDALWLWLRELRARGLREIRGDLVLDRSLFELGPQDPAAFDGQPLRAYNVIPDALLVNFKAVQLTFAPNDAAGYTVLAEPLPAQLEVTSQIRATEGSCDFWRTGLRYELVPIANQGNRQRLAFSGSIPASCGVQVWSLGLMEHRAYDEALFRELWTEIGGKLAGNVRDGAIPASARSFAVHESPPLADMIRDVNKWSNNVMARQIFLTLGAASGRTPAREADGDAAIRAWLKSRDLAMPELVLENGSGLSRRERVSAEGLARLLVAAYKSPVMPEYVASLPLWGVDGTLKKRSNGATGRAHLKGGTLDNVRAVAGYVLDRSGKAYVMVFIANHPNAGSVQAAQDAMVQWIAERG